MQQQPRPGRPPGRPARATGAYARPGTLAPTQRSRSGRRGSARSCGTRGRPGQPSRIAPGRWKGAGVRCSTRGTNINPHVHPDPRRGAVLLSAHDPAPGCRSSTTSPVPASGVRLAHVTSGDTRRHRRVERTRRALLPRPSAKARALLDRGRTRPRGPGRDRYPTPRSTTQRPSAGSRRCGSTPTSPGTGRPTDTSTMAAIARHEHSSLPLLTIDPPPANRRGHGGPRPP